MQVRILLTSNLLKSSALLKRRFPFCWETPFAYLIRSLAHTRQYMCALMMGMIYQFTQNGLPPDCHAERSEASVTDSSLTLRMTVERSVIDEVAPSVCERMTCSVNMYIITNKYD